MIQDASLWWTSLKVFQREKPGINMTRCSLHVPQRYSFLQNIDWKRVEKPLHDLNQAVQAKGHSKWTNMNKLYINIQNTLNISHRVILVQQKYLTKRDNTKVKLLNSNISIHTCRFIAPCHHGWFHQEWEPHPEWLQVNDSWVILFMKQNCLTSQNPSYPPQSYPPEK